MALRAYYRGRNIGGGIMPCRRSYWTILYCYSGGGRGGRDRGELRWVMGEIGGMGLQWVGSWAVFLKDYSSYFGTFFLGLGLVCLLSLLFEEEETEDSEDIKMPPFNNLLDLTRFII
jgi:hypothetical protein